MGAALSSAVPGLLDASRGAVLVGDASLAGFARLVGEATLFGDDDLAGEAGLGAGPGLTGEAALTVRAGGTFLPANSGGGGTAWGPLQRRLVSWRLSLSRAVFW